MQTDWRKLHGDAFRGQRALITGGAGFIGSHLAEALVGLGAKVVVLDNLITGQRGNLDGLDVELVQASILDEQALRGAVAGCGLVFHQAAAVSVFHSVEQPQMFHEVNGLGTLRVLQAAREAGVRRVMFAASSSAYGDSQVLPKVESMPALPRSPYAATKVYGEALCRAFAGSYGLDTVCLRYFNIFGPRQAADSAYAAAIAAFAKVMLRGQVPTIYGDGEQSRDFTFVHNAVHANLLAARRPQPIGGDVVNVGTAQRITINRLVSDIADLLGRPELRAAYAPARAGDVRHSLADLGTAKRILAYEPICDFRAGLKATLDWYKQVLG
jgi:nucleoside-diphosphate-sugar epimerase